MKTLARGLCGLAVILGGTGWAQVTQRVSVNSSGGPGGEDSFGASISADGRYVAFWSSAINLVLGDMNFAEDVFVRDRWSGTTERVSVSSGGEEGNEDSEGGSISADGRYVTFTSWAYNLVPGDTIGFVDAFVRDRQSGTTERVSVDSGGAQGNSHSWGGSISADGRYVAFASLATNLVGGDTNGTYDVFIRDRVSGTTERVSVDSGGAQGNSDSWGGSISADGRYVAFDSDATNLVSGDTNGFGDVFVRDRQSGTTERVSLDSGGAQGNGASFYPSISADGRFMGFTSWASNLVPVDTYAVADVFLRDRAHGGYASLCDPGVSGVHRCPCSNPPSGPDRGCDNSSATGGASLSASGGAYLSSDSLLFTTTGEKPTALSIVLQGTMSISGGAIFGQGVSCIGESLKSLYAKTASGGSITAPNFLTPDPTVHARSATLGDPIPAGSTRWYMVLYRDPTVLGGCPASSTFNTTQTRQVPWLP